MDSLKEKQKVLYFNRMEEHGFIINRGIPTTRLVLKSDSILNKLSSTNQPSLKNDFQIKVKYSNSQVDECKHSHNRN